MPELWADDWPLNPLQSSINPRTLNLTVTPAKPNPLTFQELILRLQAFWAERGCVLQQPYDVEVGAGTMAPETFLRVLGTEALQGRVRAAFSPSC